MLLSVIIPVFNTDIGALASCVVSFAPVRQSGDVEIVVVDDGSEEPVATGDYRLLRISHCGAAGARNAGIAEAKGRFVWFVDADDRVDEAQLQSLLDTLRALPDTADLLHTGPMVSASVGLKKENHLSVATRTALSDIVVPRSAWLDHTTYIISRKLLEENNTLRYPEGHFILEDSLFVLQLLERAGSVYLNESLRPYIRQTSPSSTTSGAWSQKRSSLFMPDVECFFVELQGFVRRHPECRRGLDAYRRMRYVYLRVFAVKGVRWPLFEGLREVLWGRRALDPKPAGFLEWMLHCSPMFRILSFISRIIRNNKC